MILIAVERVYTPAQGLALGTNRFHICTRGHDSEPEKLLCSEQFGALAGAT